MLSSGKANLGGIFTHLSLTNPPNVYSQVLVMLRADTACSPRLWSLTPHLQLLSYWFGNTGRVQPPIPTCPAVVFRVQTFFHTLYKCTDTSPAALVSSGKNKKKKTHSIKMQHGSHEEYRVHYTPHLLVGILHFNSSKDQQ